MVNEVLSSAEHGDRHRMLLTHYSAKITMTVAEVCMLYFALAAGMEHALSALLLVSNKSLNCSNLFDCPHLAYGCLSVLLSVSQFSTTIYGIVWLCTIKVLCYLFSFIKGNNLMQLDNSFSHCKQKT